MDIARYPERLGELMKGRDMVVYLARKSPHEAMTQMTDMVFEALLEQVPVPLVIGSSSVHVVDGAYSVNEGLLSILSERRFSDIPKLPNRILSSIPACPTNPYGQEKAHVEEWVQRFAGLGHGAVAARWGGINAKNALSAERGYFALWCHQEDAARFVHACYTTYLNGALRSGAHYFVVSDNTYNIFDIELTRKEIGYRPIHNAEAFYE